MALTRESLSQQPTPRIMKSGLVDVSPSHSLRCDAKQAENRFRRFDSWIKSVPNIVLGELLPNPIVKGSQPDYSATSDGGIPVINTMAIHDMTIDISVCRHASSVNYGLEQIRKPRAGDVLLTVDGGTSIGKPAIFDLQDNWAVDSHVAILRPEGIPAELLVYFLASPLGQLQFQRAESGASGQTSVTEEDIRRFRFPRLSTLDERKALKLVGAARQEAERLRQRAAEIEDNGWQDFLKISAPDL